MIPYSYFSSTAHQALRRLKAAHQGWKVRKILESDKWKTMQSQHKDLETYYTDQIKVQPGNKGLKDKAKADLGRSREQYIGFVKRVSESDKNWYLNVNNGESLANKRARV